MSIYSIKTSKYVNAALSNTASVVKNSKGSIYQIYVLNTNAAVTYIQIYDSASVTVGTTVAIQSYGIPANGVLNISITAPDRLAFLNNITIAATTTATGSTAPTTPVVANIIYS